MTTEKEMLKKHGAIRGKIERECPDMKPIYKELATHLLFLVDEVKGLEARIDALEGKKKAKR